MVENELQEAARYVRNSSVNIQAEFTVGWEGETLFILRATPWRNSARPNRMILVAESTLDSALLLLAAAIEQGLWLPLDWRAKPIQVGVYEPEYPEPRSLHLRTQSLRENAARKPMGLYEPTDDPGNAS